VLLDRSVHRLDGIFNRFGIKQRFANPEVTILPNALLTGPFRQRHIPGRIPLGSNLAFKEDIPLLPASPVIFADASSIPWMRMSEGALMHDPRGELTAMTMSARFLPRGFWNYSGRIKFYVRVTEKPVGDIEFALTASLREEAGSVMAQHMLVYANERRIGEWLWAQHGTDEKTVTIPLEIIEESFGSPLNLLVLRFELTDAETDDELEFSMMLEEMAFRTPVFEL